MPCSCCGSLARKSLKHICAVFENQCACSSFKYLNNNDFNARALSPPYPLIGASPYERVGAP